MTTGITCAGLVAFVLYSSLGSAAYGKSDNLFPNPNFDDFEGDLPTGWTSRIWNQPMVKEKIHRSSPGRNGEGYCLELEPTTPIALTTLASPAFGVSANQDYLFKGFYASTCQGTTTDKRWMDAEGVSVAGNWLDANKEQIGSFTIALPDTQDRWIEFYQEVRSPDGARELQIQIFRRWVGGRLRFDDFSLRQGKIMDLRKSSPFNKCPMRSSFLSMPSYPLAAVKRSRGATSIPISTTPSTRSRISTWAAGAS